jgi:hypothetical protein
VELDPEIVVWRERDRLPRDRFGSLPKPEANNPILYCGWVAPFDPEAIGVFGKDLIEVSTLFRFGTADLVSCQFSHLG